jgi:hypothetical protein
LVQVIDNIVDMLDTNAQADGSRADPCEQLLFGRHLPMGGRSRMAGEGPRIA